MKIVQLPQKIKLAISEQPGRRRRLRGPRSRACLLKGCERQFRPVWTLESFPFKKQPGVSRRQIQELAELEFIPKATNLVFIGPTAVGKTGLASGLLLKALQNGYRGLFIRAQDLFEEMYASLANRASRKLIRAWFASMSCWLTSSRILISAPNRPTSSLS